MINKQSGRVVLITHDLCQILNMSLDNAIKSYANTDHKKGIFPHLLVNDKMFFEDDFINKTVKLKVEDFPIKDREKYTNQEFNILEELKKYGKNDVIILKQLYEDFNNLFMNENNNKIDILNCFTTGSMVHYLWMQELPENVTFKKNNKSRYLHTKLFLCDNYENEFIRKSIIGGKTIARVNLLQNKRKDILKGYIKNPLYYLDINSMYASVMSLKSYPYGKPRFLNNEEIRRIKQN